MKNLRFENPIRFISGQPQTGSSRNKENNKTFQSDDGDQDIEDMLLLDHDPDDLLNEDSEKDVAADELLLSPHDGKDFWVDISVTRHIWIFIDLYFSSRK